jgi:hypothetical protein
MITYTPDACDKRGCELENWRSQLETSKWEDDRTAELPKHKKDYCQAHQNITTLPMSRDPPQADSTEPYHQQQEATILHEIAREYDPPESQSRVLTPPLYTDEQSAPLFPPQTGSSPRILGDQAAGVSQEAGCSQARFVDTRLPMPNLGAQSYTSTLEAIPQSGRPQAPVNGALSTAEHDALVQRFEQLIKRDAVPGIQSSGVDYLS